MRKSYATMFGLLLAALIMAVSGCSEKSGSSTGGTSGGEVRQLQVVMGDSTLEFLPGDSASTNVIAIARDGNGLVIANQRVIVTLQNPALGLLEFSDPARRDTTNDQGQVQMVFRTFGQYGANAILAQAESGVSTSLPFSIREALGVIENIWVTINPHELRLSAGSVDSAFVRIVVTKEGGSPVPNINLNVRRTGGGHFSQVPATDANGVVAFYYYPDNFEGWTHVSASAGGRTGIDSCRVERITITGSLQLTVDSLVLNASGCVSQTLLHAVLRDQFGTAVIGDTIFFGTPENRGTAGAWQVTNQFGEAIDTLCGGGIPNELDPADSALITARYPRWGLYDSVNVRINPAADIGQVTLFSSGTQSTAGGDSVSLTVQCFYDNGAPVSGLNAIFYAECGFFTADTVRLNGGRLAVDQYWSSCPTVSPPGEPFDVWCEVNGVLSNVIPMIVDPGDARRIQIAAESPVIPVRSSVQLQIVVADTFGNLVRDGIAVICSTSAGTLSSRIVSTNVDGIAFVTLNSGTQAGSVTVKAQLGVGSADSTVVQVLPGDANSIQLEISPQSVEAAGTGGQSSAQLRASVRDANNNPAPDGIWVAFTILPGNPGGGINIDNVGLTDSAQTTNGLAVVTLNAGTALGGFSIQACATVDGPPVCASSSAGSVVSGPPASIVIYPNEVGDDAGGSAWDLEFSAIVLDARNNAVRCSVAVYFDVTPDTAQIVSREVYTCNPDKNNVRRPGTAYTTLRYLSPATNQTVLITARTAPPNSAVASLQFQLPIQDPTIDLIVTPNSWNFTERGIDLSQFWCTAYVQDGHSTLINGAEVVLTAQRGQLFTAATGGTAIADGRRFTGPAGSSPQNTAGMCFVWLRGDIDFVFPGPVNEVTCEVRAEVEGYGEAVDAVVVNYQR